MWYFTDQLQSETGQYVKCIEIGGDGIGAGSFTSIFENIKTQCDTACKEVLADENFQDEFSVIGLSQGGLIGRCIVESCPTKKPVRNFVTLGGPHYGVDASPNCFSGEICDMLNFIIRNAVYFPFIQQIAGPAGYFRDPNNLQDYMNYSVLLPYLNNEKNANPTYKERFSALNKALFVMFSEDNVLFPKETAWFQPLKSDLTPAKLEDTDFYKKDYIGLKSLVEAGKVEFKEYKGLHLQFTDKQIKEDIIPTLTA